MSTNTRQVMVGNVPLGGGASVSVQSMTNTDTADVESTLSQIMELSLAGCDIVRMSVYNEGCVKAVRQLVDLSPVPLVADVHFDHKLAIGAIENGIAKLRINPGNIGGEANVKILADCLKAHHVPVRIGVNAGSLEKEILAKYGGATAQGMVESALSHAKMLEDCGFYDIVISIKASDVKRTIESYRLISKLCNYPLHLGVTEAGTIGMGTIKSAIGIGSLLTDGIGDTIRVSLTGNPVNEPIVGIDILKAVGLRKEGIEIISCPTCGRCNNDIENIVNTVVDATKNIIIPLKVAVMGCVVNGPGEAKEADLGIACGGEGSGALFVKGQPSRAVKGDLARILIEEIYKCIKCGTTY